MRIGLTAVTLAAVACGSHAKPSTTPTPATQPPVGQPAVQPPVNRGNDGSVRLGPSALRYVMHSVVHIDQEFQGMHQPLDFGIDDVVGERVVSRRPILCSSEIPSKIRTAFIAPGPRRDDARRYVCGREG